jgi:hypothetical protein
MSDASRTNSSRVDFLIVHRESAIVADGPIRLAVPKPVTRTMSKPSRTNPNRRDLGRTDPVIARHASATAAHGLIPVAASREITAP